MANIVNRNQEDTFSGSMIFHGKWMKAIDVLPVNKQLNFLKMVVNYGCNGIEPSDDDMSINLALWFMIKMEIDADKNKRQETIVKHREAQKRYSQKMGKDADNIDA